MWNIFLFFSRKFFLTAGAFRWSNDKYHNEKKKGEKKWKKEKKEKKRREVNLWIQIELIGKPERLQCPIDGGHVDTFGVRFFNWIYSFSFYLRSRERRMSGEKRIKNKPISVI